MTSVVGWLRVAMCALLLGVTTGCGAAVDAAQWTADFPEFVVDFVRQSLAALLW